MLKQMLSLTPKTSCREGVSFQFSSALESLILQLQNSVLEKHVLAVIINYTE